MHGSADLLRDVRDRRAEEVGFEFKRRVPSYLPTDQNLDDVLRTLNWNAFGQDSYDDADALINRLMREGFWTVDNLTRVYEALDREGILQVPARHVIFPSASACTSLVLPKSDERRPRLRRISSTRCLP